MDNNFKNQAIFTFICKQWNKDRLGKSITTQIENQKAKKRIMSTLGLCALKKGKITSASNLMDATVLVTTTNHHTTRKSPVFPAVKKDKLAQIVPQKMEIIKNAIMIIITHMTAPRNNNRNNYQKDQNNQRDRNEYRNENKGRSQNRY